MKVTAIIPARLASTRLHHKPLTPILGKALVLHVYDQVAAIPSIDRVIIATDDQQIIKVAEQHGAEVFLTDINHISGTDRIAEIVALKQIKGIIINIQGDEPLVNQEIIQPIIEAFIHKGISIASVCQQLHTEEDIHSPNIVKVVRDIHNNALYFSRYPIPYVRDGDTPDYYKHIGIYAFRAEVLLNLVKLKPSKLELSEKLEQLRWLENGYRVHMLTTDHEMLGVDTSEDVKKLEEYLTRIMH